jgi:acyl-coenzyme A thioesterase PaaI-like protein
MPDATTPGAPFAALTGAVLEEKREGYTRLSVVVTPQHLGRDGMVHTGVITTLLDSAVGIALGQMRGDEVRRGRPHATVGMNTGFLGTAAPGDEPAAR